MAHSGGIVTAPVSFADVNATLGTSHTDLGNLCKASQVNKWAKYKPVVKNLISTTDQLANDKTWLGSATWWKGTNNNCGISVSSFTTVADARTAIINKTPVYAYEKPSGGTTAPYRLTDFNQYDHNAKPPTTDVSATDAQMKTGATLTITAIGTADSGTWLKLSDIGVYANYYYLAAIYDANGNLKLLQTSSKKLGQYSAAETIEIVIPYNSYSGVLAENSTYTVFMMISSVAYSAATSALNGTYIPLPTDKGNYGMQSTTFRCLNSAMYVTIRAWTIGSGSTGVNWQCDFYGNTSATGVLRLIYAATGAVVSGQSVNLDFSTGTDIGSGGRRLVSRVGTYLVLPDTDHEKYLVEFVGSGVTQRANIGYDVPA